MTREIDGGLETLRVTLPAVITTDLRLNQPRYISLPNIVKAKQKPIQIINADQLKVDLTPRLKCLKVQVPPPRLKGKILKSAEELVTTLKEQGIL